ncbi:hypothetical protein DOY81_015584 [Sarcophaga bullata]|nr:hypothetical protein DOY81_015584 [Sarcophaga bullata]
MNTFFTIWCFALVACTVAKPGYNYQQPQQTFLTSAPVSTNSVISLQQSKPIASFSIQAQPQLISAQPVQYAPQVQYVSNVVPQQYSTTPVAQQFVGAITQQQLPNVQQQTVYAAAANPVVTSNQFQYQQPQQQQQHHQQQTIVNKEIFIHSAPEETEIIGQQQDIEAAPIHKNYRIVFIKAPAQNLKLNVQAIKQAQAANEEKTAIYVLSKKPDLAKIQNELVNVQNVEKVSKPEVFFIKYKTQEEAQRAQQEIQAQYDALGGSTRVTDEGVKPITSVIGSVSQNAVSSAGSNAVRGNFVNVGSVAPISIASGSNQQNFIKKFVQNGSSQVSYGVNAKLLSSKKQ